MQKEFWLFFAYNTSNKTKKNQFKHLNYIFVTKDKTELNIYMPTQLIYQNTKQILHKGQHGQTVFVSAVNFQKRFW